MSSDVRIPLVSSSPDVERVEALKVLFPEAFTEGRVDFDRLKQALGQAVQSDRERYGLNWAGKSQAIQALQSLSVGTLQPMREESVNFDTTENTLQILVLNIQAFDKASTIMQEKEKLLSMEEPLRFIFSHSALREGWDNPNVFQICTLNETRSETKKRQEIGRGLRLPVDETGNRVRDPNINRLMVIANESYNEFCNPRSTWVTKLESQTWPTLPNGSPRSLIQTLSPRQNHSTRPEGFGHSRYV